MSIENRTFTLVGKFDDRITKGLKAVNKQLEGLSKFGKRSYNPFKGMEKGVGSLNSELKETQKSLKTIQGQLKQISKFKFKFDRSGIKAAQEDVKNLGRGIDSVAKKGFNFDKSGIRAAQEEVKVLGREIDNVAKNGFNFDKSGIQAAQQEASVLGDILKANALIKAGEGVGNALTAGASSAVNMLGKGANFAGKQFGDAVKDQMEDLQARGSLYGSLRKQGLLTGKTAEEQTQDYRQTKVISRANEQAIGQLIRTSAVSTGTVTTLNRQLTDNLLPTLLKAKGITSLSGKSREELDTVFGGKKGIGTDLARLYEQMATVMPSPSYARMGAMGFTQAITSGTINKQLAIFENNPVLVEALKTIDGGIQGTADIGKRIQILRKALEVAAPTMMLDEMRNTIAGGMQAVQDTIMNPTVGILSLGADIANEGKKTLQQYKDSGAYQLKMERVKANIIKSADKMELTGLKRKEYIAKQEKEAYDKLNDALESADSPIEKISVALAPLLQSFASLLNSFGNQFIGPVTNIMNSLYKPFAQLEVTFDRLVTDVEAGEKTMGEALGRAVGELLKAIASYFNPEKAGEEIGGGIQRFFADFKKGFDSIEGDKWANMVVDSLESILMNLVFNEGDVMKGFTPLADALSKVFLLFAAPAFVTTLISGLTPLVLHSMGKMIFGVMKGLAARVLAANAAASAAPVVASSLGMNAAYLTGGTAAAATTGGAAGGGAAAVGGLAAVPVWGWVAALAASLVVFEKPIMALTNTMQSIGKKMQESSNWLTSSFGQITQGIGQLFAGITQFFNGLWEIVSGLLSGDADRVIAGIKKLFTGIGNAIVGIGRMVGGLGGVVIGAIGNLFNTIAELLRRAANKVDFLNIIPDDKPTKPTPGKPEPPPPAGAKPGSGQWVTVDRSGRKEWRANAKGSAHPFVGNLGQAINYEMANKPPGSDLVIANSYERIYPPGEKPVLTAAKGLNIGGAAGGLGLKDFMSTLTGGFSQVATLISRTSEQAKIRDDQRWTQNNARLASLQQQLTKMATTAGGSMFGTGGPGGNVVGVGKQLLAMGLQVGENPFFQYGSGYLPNGGGRVGKHAPGSYHYQGRALDVDGPPGKLDQVYAMLKGTNPSELLWRVPGHYDHLHVAYALGAGNPAFFSSQDQAMAWEKKASLGNAKVSSITSRQGEFGGGDININSPITINQQPGQDSEELAAIVAMRIGEVVAARKASQVM